MKYHTSTHSISFEHKYKVGDTVWYYNEFMSEDGGFYSGTISIVEYNPDNGQVTYFISGPGYVDEEDLFKSKGQAIKHESNKLLNEIQNETKSIDNLKFAASRREANLNVRKEKLASFKKLLTN